MNNIFGVIGAGGLIGVFVAIVILATISYHEHRMLDQYNYETAIGYNTSIEKLDTILLLLIELENNKNGTNWINRR